MPHIVLVVTLLGCIFTPMYTGATSVNSTTLENISTTTTTTTPMSYESTTTPYKSTSSGGWDNGMNTTTSTDDATTTPGASNASHDANINASVSAGNNDTMMYLSNQSTTSTDDATTTPDASNASHVSNINTTSTDLEDENATETDSENENATETDLNQTKEVVVTFTVTISLSLTEFDKSAQDDYMVGVGEKLSIDPTDVDIKSIQVSGQRRGVGPIDVTTTVNVSPQMTVIITQKLSSGTMDIRINGQIYTLAAFNIEDSAAPAPLQPNLGGDNGGGGEGGGSGGGGGSWSGGGGGGGGGSWSGGVGALVTTSATQTVTFTTTPMVSSIEDTTGWWWISFGIAIGSVFIVFLMFAGMFALGMHMRRRAVSTEVLQTNDVEHTATDPMRDGNNIATSTGFGQLETSHLVNMNAVVVHASPHDPPVQFPPYFPLYTQCQYPPYIPLYTPVTASGDTLTGSGGAIVIV
jgi:uncharacterized membrane protein YgcG